MYSLVSSNIFLAQSLWKWIQVIYIALKSDPATPPSKKKKKERKENYLSTSKNILTTHYESEAII